MNVYPPTVLPGSPPLAGVLLRLADDHLILGHRLSQWCGRAPMLEEDLSMPNMALDHLGQASALYDYLLQSITAPELHNGDAADRDAQRFNSTDDFAFLRHEREYVNCLLVEKEESDFAYAMLKQFYFAAFMLPYWQQQLSLADPQLAAIAAKAEKEIAYHLRHCGEWVIRLGDGTAESARRMKVAAEDLHRYTPELFQMDEVHLSCCDLQLVPDYKQLHVTWQATVEEVFRQAKLVVPQVAFGLDGGRQGRHLEEFGYLLTELQYMQRTFPGAKW